MILGRTYDTKTLQKTSEQKLELAHEICVVDGDYVVLRELIETSDGRFEVGNIINTFCYRDRYKLDT